MGEFKMVRDGFMLKYFPSELFEETFKLDYTGCDYSIEPTRFYKLSFCTTCMGRMEDVKRTLPKNIEDSSSYPNREFVLLDYNSKDGLGDWVKQELMPYIDIGLLNYYRTEEPKYYSMAHSRNIAFKVATGDIVNNVDADHYFKPGFPEQVNKAANQFPKSLVLVKSHQKARGRLGFFKKEFIKKLGGYNEDILYYGWDDRDITIRAYRLGFNIVKTGGEFFQLVEGHSRHTVANYPHKDWRFTQRRNVLVSLINILHKRYVANEGEHWGKARLVKNFGELVEI